MSDGRHPVMSQISDHRAAGFYRPSIASQYGAQMSSGPARGLCVGESVLGRSVTGAGIGPATVR